MPRPERVQLGILLLFFCVLWLAGGASRGDQLGQSVVRAAAALVLAAAALVGARPSFRDVRAVVILLLLALTLALIQLVPMPPGWWQALPGRSLFEGGALASGQPQPWRSLAVSPGGAANAAASLIVPAAALVLTLQSGEVGRRWMLGIIIGAVAASALAGLLQFAGAGFNNPLINTPLGQVGGSFANRNHFALFLAIGCLITPVWAFGHRKPGWRAPFALGLMLLFMLMILAAGSRAGLLVGVLGICLGVGIARKAIRRELARYPRWVFFGVVAAVIVIFAIAILLAVVTERAIAIDRIMSVDPEQDMRRRGLPVVLHMIGIYFPVGTGLGSFDSVFRIHEPLGLLKVTYFNHAHNDWLEVPLETGVPGMMLMAASVIWWGRASFSAWRGRVQDCDLAKLGSSILLLVMIASVFDYPARTPMIMAIVVVAAVWLSGRNEKSGGAALRHENNYL